MRRFLRRAGVWASARNLLFLTVAVGVLSSQSAPGTLAFFTSTVTSANNTFTAGTLDLDNTLGTGTASTLTTASFSWDTSASGTDCGNLSGVDLINQQMTPGHFCVAPVTVRGNSNVDAWLRMRLVRQTSAAGTNNVNHELNNRLRAYVHAYANQGDRDTACTTANYQPTLASSAGQIANSATQTALRSLNQDGAALGTHPTTAADTGLLNATQLATATRSGNSLAISTGTGGAPTETNMTAGTYFNLLGNDEVTNPVATSGTASNTLSGAHAAGVVTIALADATGFAAGQLLTIDTGTNTEVRTIASVAAPNVTLTEELYLAHANGVAVTATAKNGTNANGTNAEAELLGSSNIKYYCMALIFPSNSGVGTANNAGDNKAVAGTNVYSLVVTAAQKAGR